MKRDFGFFTAAVCLVCASTAFAQPANDHFANRAILTGLNANWSGTLVGATIEPGEPPRGSFAPTASVWYAWSAPLAGNVEIGFSFVEFFAVFGVYHGTNLNDLVAVTNGVATGTANFRAEAGETYAIAVDSGFGQTDAFWMALTLTPAPPNDNFAKATRVLGWNGWLQSSNASASVEAGEPRHAGANAPFGKSIWWRWTAPDHGTLRIDLSRLATNTALAVYTGGSVSNLTLLASNRFLFGSTLSVRVAVGTEYFIAAAHTNDVLMDFSFSFTPAPVNDYFTNRLVLTGNTGTVVATTVDATTEFGEPSVSFGPPQTLWWTWTAPTTSPTTFQFSDQTHMLEAYTNNALGSLQALSGLDFLFQGFGRYVMPNARAGGTYQFRVRPNSAAGPFNFVWYQSSALASNNHLANRQQLAGTNITVSGSLAGATREAGEPSHGAISGSSSVWYGWRAPAAGVVRFTLSSSGFNLVAACYRGTNYGALTTLVSDINTRSPGAATAAFNVLAGADYSIAVDSPFSSDTFSFTIVFSPAPPNDNFTNRIVLPGVEVTTSGTTLGASKETNEPNHAGSTSRTGTIWWTWRAASNGPVTVVAEGGPLDPVLAVYTGTQVSGLVPIASNNDYLQNGVFDSRVTFNALAGTNYHIAVATTPVAAGDITLHIRRGLPPTVTWLQPTNDLILAPGSNVEFIADAVDSDGSVTQVTFQVASTVTIVSTLTAPPYKLAFTNLPYGTFAYRAYAIDDDGLIGLSTQRQARVPPLNDYFSNRFTIPDNTVSVTGTMSGVARDANEPRQLAGAPRVAWWSWLALTNGTAHLAITNINGGSRAVSVYHGADLGALTLVATSSGGNRATFEVESGVQYHIAAETFSDGEVIISFITPAFVPNDRFTNATVIAGTNAVIQTSNVEATAEPGEPRHGGWDAGRSLWWTWTAPTNGVVALRTAGSSFDTTLGVYTGNSVSNLTLVVSNRTSSFSGNSAASFAATAGTTYRIAVDGYFGAFGNIVLSFGFFTTPINDSFSQRIQLIGQTNIVSGNNTAATRETGEPSASGFGVNKTLWWTWTAPMSGRVIVSTEGSALRNTLGVFTGSLLPGLTSVGNAASLVSSNNVVQFDATAGAAYQIQLDSQSTPGGELVLRVMQPHSAANDDFAQRFTLNGYVANVPGHNFNATRETSEPPHDGGQNRTVWWSWTAPETRSVSIVPHSAETPKMAIYTGTAINALSLVASNFPGGNAAGAASFNAVAGTEYHFALFLRLSQMGEIVFSILPNEAPVVQLLAPAPGVAFHPGENFMLNANASDSDGSISNVQFVAGPFSRIDATAPYSVIASNIPLGDYTATARATDNLGAFTTSPAINFRIAPLNDDFAEAAILFGEFVQITATNIGAAKQPGEPDHALQAGGRSIWFSWTAPANARFSVTTEGSSFDTLLAVYTGDSVSNLAMLAQNDDRNFFDTWSELQFSANAGTNYWIAVDGHAGATGTTLLKVRRVADNDLFTNAITLSGHTTTRGRNPGAALEANEPFHDDLQVGGSLWWTWTAPNSGRYLAVTAGSDFDTVLAVYSGQVLSNLTLVATDDDGAGRQHSVARFDALAGQEYRIAVAGFGVARGDIQLAIATNGVPTLFGPMLPSGSNFAFRALSEPGWTNIAQRSVNFSNWTSFDSKVASDWWLDFRDPLPATNSIQVYRVTQP